MRPSAWHPPVVVDPFWWIFRNFRAQDTTLIRKKRCGTFSISFCFKVVILSHIPFSLPVPPPTPSACKLR